ncbi:hypothetical protein [Streptomyces sp. NPDC050585]|uniref:hypothetical protein n=1 Tax=Streptomyces sp. NPDC050585 TaxID=3365632 RepID=UPI0037A3A6F5
MNSEDKHPTMALPRQVPPVDRAGTPQMAALRQTAPGVQAAAQCSQMKGLARQMCYAAKGVYV